MSMIGKTLGNFEITTQLGRGGMGEVYRAKDLKLSRDVAIKVLPEEFARDADRVARFQREAKLLASLNHSNIAAIHGLEEFGGIQFLVLELVEGETLADQLKCGPIPVEESLKLALQIAEALEAAHEKGVIHRDLKPANIKVTPEGKVKVLDFGLAKAFAGEQSDLNLSNSPTLSNAATQQGVILGTAAYMSPEQARGKSVDKRADIWAFGCVLYEMLTGRQTWTGATVTDIMAAALAKDPDFSSLPPNIHPRISELLDRCLQKDPTERFRDVGDIRIEIKKALADPRGVLVQPVTIGETRRKLRTILAWAAATLILIIIAGIAVWKLKPLEPGQVMRFDYDLPEGQQFSNLAPPVLAVSHDGKLFVYSTPKGLFLRSVDEWTAKLVPGTEGSTQQPFFSPDGKWIGYFSVADKKLKKIGINGGAPVVLCDVTQPEGVSWYQDGTIVYGQYFGDIMRISANGGIPESLVKMKSELLLFPQILPDGKSVLYTSAAGTIRSRIMVQSLRSGEPKELFAGSGARYLPTGHIVYGLANNNNLFAIPYDLDRLEVAGGTVPILEGVANGYQYAVSDSGTLVYIPGTASAATSGPRTLALVWVDMKGKEQPIVAAPNDYRNPRMSPDGTKVVLAVYSGSKSDIWILDLVRENLTRLTFNEASNVPLWTPDGQRIAFRLSGSGSGDISSICWKPSDGTGEEEKLNSEPQGCILSPMSWSGDGKTLLLSKITLSGEVGYNIETLSVEGSRKITPLLKEKYDETQPRISPDGRWMAYVSNESGQREVYVRPFPAVDKGKWQVSTGGGDIPLWSPDGHALFYRNGDSVMAVMVQTEPTFKPGKTEILFRGTYVLPSSGNTRPWDLSPDGKRFLMMKEVVSADKPAAETPRKINIVLNWFEELKQRVPVK